MCCFFLLLFFFGPRAVLVLEWIFGHKIQVVFDHWYWPLLGLIFLPWTTLMYVLLWNTNGRGVDGWEWIFVALAVLVDLTSHGDSARRRAA